MSMRTHLAPGIVDGAEVVAGAQLTGDVKTPRDPKKILDIDGIRTTQQYLGDEVQKVYREQGVSIHDKHVEVIVRQMLRRVAVSEPGDSDVPARSEGRRPGVREREQAARGRGQAPGRGSSRAHGDHQGIARDRVVAVRRLLPGDDAGAHRSRDRGQERRPRGPQGERHHRQADPCGDRDAAVPRRRSPRPPTTSRCPSTPATTRTTSTSPSGCGHRWSRQSGEDAAILAVAPAPEAPSPVAVAEAGTLGATCRPPRPPTPLEATDAAIAGPATPGSGGRRRRDDRRRRRQPGGERHRGIEAGRPGRCLCNLCGRLRASSAGPTTRPGCSIASRPHHLGHLRPSARSQPPRHEMHQESCAHDRPARPQGTGEQDREVQDAGTPRVSRSAAACARASSPRRRRSRTRRCARSPVCG